LRVTEFNSAQEAERFVGLIRGAMMELVATKGGTLWITPLSPVERNQQPMNVYIRDSLAEQFHPAWIRRTDGTVTDGGIGPNQSCILAEHERIWEYPLMWGKPLRQITVGALQTALGTSSGKPNLVKALNSPRLTAAVKFLNLANAVTNREVGYVLYATVLETLADEDSQTGAKRIVAQCRVANGEAYDETEGGELYRIRNKLLHEGVFKLDGKILSWEEFSERYWRIRTLAGQAVMLKLDELSG
jgi:hypothetical protein